MPILSLRHLARLSFRRHLGASQVACPGARLCSPALGRQFNVSAMAFANGPDLVGEAVGSSEVRESAKAISRVPSVAIIGAGSVGAAVANSVINERIGAQILMVDRDEEKCIGEVLDLSDAAALAGCFVNVATMQEAGQADIVIITAGAKSKPDEPRTALIDRNVKIMSSIMEGLKPIGENTVIMQVANPVDVLTGLAHKLSGLPTSRVIGSGTFLDTQRLRASVGGILGISSRSIHLNVVGEHGDSQVAVWSSGTVGGTPLTSFPELSPDVRKTLETNCANKANEIIKRKGATFFGVGACAAAISRSILFDMGAVYPVSAWNDRYGMYISQPSVIGRGGIKKVLEMNVDEEEQVRLDESAGRIRKVLDAANV